MHIDYEAIVDEKKIIYLHVCGERLNFATRIRGSSLKKLPQQKILFVMSVWINESFK